MAHIPQKMKSNKRNMSLTNPKDFETLGAIIPKGIRDNVWFFPLRSNKKNPDVAAGTCLKGNEAYRLSYSEALQRLKWGSNVGIYALQGGIMFLDLDVSKGKLLASQDFLDALESNPTLRIKTRNGGIQYYFLNDGKYANQQISENGTIVGELRTDWWYVVSVGSHVEPDEHCRGEPDGTYRIQKECPITQFQSFGCYFKKNDEVKTDKVKTFFQKTTQTDISYEKHIIDLEKRNMTKRPGTPIELKYLRLRYG